MVSSIKSINALHMTGHWKNVADNTMLQMNYNHVVKYDLYYARCTSAMWIALT